MEYKIDLDALKQFLLERGAVYLGEQDAEIAKRLKWLIFDAGIAESRPWAGDYFDRYNRWRGNTFGRNGGSFVFFVRGKPAWDLGGNMCQQVREATEIVSFQDLSSRFPVIEDVKSCDVSLTDLFGFEIGVG